MKQSFYFLAAFKDGGKEIKRASRYFDNLDSAYSAAQRSKDDVKICATQNPGFIKLNAWEYASVGYDLIEAF